MSLAYGFKCKSAHNYPLHYYFARSYAFAGKLCAVSETYPHPPAAHHSWRIFSPLSRFLWCSRPGPARYCPNLESSITPIKWASFDVYVSFVSISGGGGGGRWVARVQNCLLPLLTANGHEQKLMVMKKSAATEQIFGESWRYTEKCS